ncbi:MAG: hypothetical protein OXC19_14405 [Bryobacterales bacterium]|nr:hypothetical protein [Bryobacterales bacterium]
MKRIVDRIPKPAGALPAQARTWLLMGVTAAIVIALLTFPGEAPESSAAESAVPASVPVGSFVGTGVVESAAQRIEEEAARETAYRLEPETHRPEPRPDGLPHPPTPLTAGSGRYAPVAADAAHALGPEEQIARQERLRRYESLRAPPLVQSRREAGAPPSLPDPGSPAEDDGTSVPEALPAMAPAPGSIVAPMAQTRKAESAGPEGPLYTLHEGESLEAVLTNRLSGDFSGPVNAMVSADVHDRTRRRLLVPRGTRALGMAHQIEERDQSRLAVVFHRLVLPDASSVRLDRSPGLNQMGETGLKDIVNRRYASAIAAAGAVGALAGLTQASSPHDAYTSRFGSARLAAGSGLAGAAERVLDRFLNRMPKLTVREGHRLRIYLTADLELPAYRTWRGPAAAIP